MTFAILKACATLRAKKNIFCLRHSIIISLFLSGLKMNELSDLVCSSIDFKFDILLARNNNIFEIMTMDPFDFLLEAGSQAHRESQEDDNEDMDILVYLPVNNSHSELL